MRQPSAMNLPAPLLICALLALLSLQPLARLITEISPGQLPLFFVSNAGQTDEAVRFQVRSLGGTLFFTPTEVVLSLPFDNPSPHTWRGGQNPILAQGEGDIEGGISTILRLRFEDTNPSPEIIAGEALPGTVNYFLGNDPAQWRTDVPTYAGVVYRDLYAGIDLAYDGTEGLLKGTYTVAAGVDPSIIGWRYDGAESIAIDAATGDLRVVLPNGNTLAEQRPTAWQEIAGARIPVDANYVLADDGRIGFALGDYDAAHALTIDPIIVYSTYLGGNSGDFGEDIAIDASGNMLVTGYSASTNFPTAGTPVQASNGGVYDVFVTKFNPAGSTLLYSTYIGGISYDSSNSIAVDSGGNAYVAGETQSTNFPVANAFQPTNAGGADAYVAKLNPTGSALLYSTYLGGADGELALSINVDGRSNVYVAGVTRSTNFPTRNPLQANNGGGFWDIFVTKLNAAGSGLVYSTYLGDDEFDVVVDMTLDSSNNVYITGSTNSIGFPTVNPFQAAHSNPCPGAGGSPCEDAYITKINATGNAIVYSTFLGGSDDDRGQAIAVDAEGNAYVTGYTGSTNFPTANALQPESASDSTAFVTKVNASGSTLVYSTYLGGSRGEAGTGIAVDAAGNAYIAGATISDDFPMVTPIQSTKAGTMFADDAFIVKLNSAGSTIIYSTYWGGSLNETSEFNPRIVVDNFGNGYVIGTTFSNDFPTVNPFQSTAGQPPLGFDSFDAYVFRITTSTDLSVTQSDSPDPVSANSDLTYTITVTNNGPDTATAVALEDTLPALTNFSAATPSQGSCQHSAGRVTCNLGDIEGGANATVTLVIVPIAGGTLSNTVSVDGNEADSNLDNNEFTENTGVDGPPPGPASATPTHTPFDTLTPSNTQTPHTPQPTLTSTPQPTPPVLTATPFTPTDTPEPTATFTGTPTMSPTWSPTPTYTPPVSPTMTSTPLPSPPPM
jgi:uncharacterized repeat protein (TIGR01451 family)